VVAWALVTGEIAGGRWVGEIYGCQVERLEDPRLVEDALRHAVRRLGADDATIKSVVYKFNPQGISAAALSPVAAVMIHTWPEDDASATLDLYFYREGADAGEVLKHLAEAFGARRENAFSYRRHRPTDRPAGLRGRS